MLFLSWVVHCLIVLLSVAFFTLFERNVIGLFHLRLGPNNVSFIGIFQPLLDAVKLLSKQDLYPLRANKIAYSLSPLFALFLSLYVWITMPILFITFSLNYSLVMFFFIGSVLVFSVLLSGWSSNSKYSLLGSLRSVSQSVSYESVFSTLIVLMCYMVLSFSVQAGSALSSLLLLFILPVWVVCTLAETHRAPFDFAEAESELVSGFNTEYSGAFFAFIFLSEYSMLLYSCILIVYLFFGYFLVVFPSALLILSTLSLSFIFIWVRITFCRFRYDLLISLSWNVLLPVTLSFFLLFIVV